MSSAVAPEVPQIPIRDIHLSPAPEWWPPAPGWWILAALVLTVVIVLTIVQVIRYRRYRRYLKVREELELVERQWREDSDPGNLIRATSRLLRRTVLFAGGDRSLVVMSGKNWADYLSSISPGDQRVSDAAMDVATQVYSNCPATDNPDAIIELADVWMRHAYTGKPVVRHDADSLAGAAS